MITATCNLKFRITKKKFYLDIYLQRTSKEIFRMGSSSFWINFTKDSLANPAISYFRKVYSSGKNAGNYGTPKLLTPANNRMIGIQMFLNDGYEGKVVSDKLQRLATISFDKTINDVISLQWNTVDSGIATPSFALVQTKWEVKN